MLNLAKSMLKDVDTGDFAGQSEFQVALYQVKADNFEDMDFIKYVQVPFERASINDGDCFIADLETNFLYGMDLDKC